MKAIMLAAGVGDRLGEIAGGLPKCLLEFNGVNLLTRHIRILERNQVPELLIVTGYRREAILAALAGLSTPLTITTVDNPDFRSGSIVSLFAAKQTLNAGDDVLLMDADVLYHPGILQKLINSPYPNCFLLDRDFESGVEPVKLCVSNGRLIEFRKQIAADLHCDFQGESVGFFKFSPDIADKLRQKAERYVSTNRNNEPYEEALRDIVLDYPDRFSYEDITGYAWLEIDFPGDVLRAQQDVLPKIEELN